MASSLPPVSDGPRSKQRSSVLQFCQPLSEVGHLFVRGQSVYHPFETYKLYDDCASQAGYIWLRGDQESWLLGEAVNLPGDKYFDPRGGGCVRHLSGIEKWNLMGLSESTAAFLSSQGLDSQLGPLACNSIPTRMAGAVAEDVAIRVAN